MNTAEYYRKVMDIVQQKGVGDSLVFEIAKKHPSIVCKAYDAIFEEPWLKSVRDFMRAGNKLAAIKEYRANTDLGLKEAKEAVETLKF